MPFKPDAPPWPGGTEVEWARYTERWWIPPVPHMLVAPGYIAPPPIGIIGKDGAGPYKSIQTILAQGVQQMAGEALWADVLTDAQVASVLTHEVDAQVPWLAGNDPDVARIPELIAQYTAAFRTAVTPV